jgi:hypothetical protein
LSIEKIVLPILDVLQGERQIAFGWQDQRCNVIADRKQYAEYLENRYDHGGITRVDLMRALAEYDALIATKRMPYYALLSTIFAAISAVASAVAAHLTYLGTGH